MMVSRTKLVGVALVIFAATIWLFWPSVHGEFWGGDDREYLRQAMCRNGLTWNAVKWAFTSTHPYYHPLTQLSFCLDYQIWGKNAVGFHVTGVFLHALNAVLVFGFLWTLLGTTSLTTGERLMAALWVAVVFAVHPLQTESVAWISERTQVLSTTFGIGCLWAYVANARRWLVWGLYLAALLCKPMAVSLPFVMLALDYYPLRRHEQLGWGRLVREKLVLIALAVALGLVTMIAKSKGVGLTSVPVIVPLSQRVFRAFVTLAFYALKLVWPSHLSPKSPISLGLSLDQWPVLASVLSVVMVTVAVVVERRRIPMLAAAWGAYVMLVLPASGLLTGAEVLAQRYAYMAMLPPLLLAGGAVVCVWRRSPTVARVVIASLLTGQLWVFAVRTRGLIPDWHDEETRQRAILREFPDSESDYEDLAKMLLDKGRAGEALAYAQRAVEIAPELCYSHMTLGSVLGRMGRLQEAMAQNEQALRLSPDSAAAQCNFGVALMELGRAPEAVEHFEQALRIDPDTTLAHDSLGCALYQSGRAQEAIKEFEAELRIHPDYAEGHYNLSLALLMAGRIQEAIAHYEQALWLKPDYAEAHNGLGTVLAQTGKIEEATAHYEQALRINPDYAAAHANLGVALAQTGRIKDAIAHFEQAIRIKPDYAEAHYNLGGILAQSGRIPEAIQHLEQALRINPDFAEAHYNLGLALEKLGRVPEAIEHYQQALTLRPDFTRQKTR